jgi:spore coat protein SA
MRIHDSRSVVCMESDGSWGFSPDRILEVPELSLFARIKGRKFLPLPVSGTFLRYAFRHLLSRLKRGDIVWCHNQLIFSAALEKRVHSMGAKMVHHFHDPNVPIMTETALRSFTPDAYIFISQALRQEWLNLFPWLKNTHVLYNGVDDALFYPSPDHAVKRTGPLTILFVGRMQPEKGVHLLIDAMRILQNRGIQAECKLVGSSFAGGSKATPYETSLRESKPSNVTFAGTRDKRDVANEFRSADIFCCPSVWQEALGMVNVEAMACGIPVVATRVGGIPEIAAEGGILLVEPNSPVEIADALQRLIQDQELRSKIAEEGLRSVRRRFTWTIIGKHYEDLTARI